MIIGISAGLFLTFALPNIIRRARLNRKANEIKRERILTQAQIDSATPVIFSLPELRIRTADRNAEGKRIKSHIVRTKPALALPRNNQALNDEVEELYFEIRTIIVDIISSKPKDTIDQPEEREYLKKQLIQAINSRLESGEIIDVYFEEFAFF